MHGALTQMGVIPALVNLGILEMESLVQVSSIHALSILRECLRGTAPSLTRFYLTGALNFAFLLYVNGTFVTGLNSCTNFLHRIIPATKTAK